MDPCGGQRGRARVGWREGGGSERMMEGHRCSIDAAAMVASAGGFGEGSRVPNNCEYLPLLDLDHLQMAPYLFTYTPLITRVENG